MKGISYQVRRRFKPGRNWLVDGELEFIRFSLLLLKKGDGFKENLGKEELGIVLLSGQVEVYVEGKIYRLGPRRDVFSESAYGLYLPGRMEWRVRAVKESELALAYAPSESDGETKLVLPDELLVHHRGREHYQRRVVDIMVSQVKASHLLIGETFNYPGQWSSYPPHRHDRHNPPKEYRLEEVYFYKIYPGQGFGLQRVYNDARSFDRAYVIENNDLVVFREGYHPVVSAPGYELYYLWVLAGAERVMKVVDDKAHSWLHNF